MTAIIAFISEYNGVYGEGDLYDPLVAYPYVVFINSWSQTYALYCLILLFKATKDEMAEINPLAKFLCVKAVVFFSFWQSIAIVILVQVGVIHARTGAADMVGTSDTQWDVADVSKGIQDFAICVEMFIAAVAHQYAFPVEDYPDVPPAQPVPMRVVEVFDMRDIYADVLDRADAVGGKARITPPPPHGRCGLGRVLRIFV